MFINIAFLFSSDKLTRLLPSMALVLLSILMPLFLPSSTIALFYFILSLVFGLTSCMSSPFPIAKLTGTAFFLSLVQEKLNMNCGDYYRHCSWPFNSKCMRSKHTTLSAVKGSNFLWFQHWGGWLIFHFSIQVILFFLIRTSLYVFHIF